MDARGTRWVLVCSWYLCFGSTLWAQSTQVATRNFVIRAPDRRLAEQAAGLAEKYRRELALEWLGVELPDWTEKCPVQIELASLPGGETSFAFVGPPGEGQPVGWQMRVFGPPERILDAVLPHEITHTVFATHFGRPLPRWADEGACTTVEHSSERAKNHQMLIEFLTSKPSRGIPFNRMFTLREYPHDILPLYAQGYSLARYLILQQGQRHFVQYVGAGMKRADVSDPLQAWNAATHEFYGYANLSDLQLAWLKWVEQGSPSSIAKPSLAGESVAGESVAGTAALLNPRANRLAAQNRSAEPALTTGGAVKSVAPDTASSLTRLDSQSFGDLGVAAEPESEIRGSWYREQMRQQFPSEAGPYRPGSIAQGMAGESSEFILQRPNLAPGGLPPSARSDPRTIWR